jgi:signal transduction histidine kinase
MSDRDWKRRLAEARETVSRRLEELAERNRSMVAIALELEPQLDQRTAELHAAQEELQRTNSELLQLTLELDDRVAQRTAEVQAKSEEIRTMSQQLWQAAKLATMGELAASIAHELNNPLATVSLRVESLLAATAPDAPQRRELDIIAQEVERMGSLVENLLHFSRRATPQISTLDVREEIGRTLELVHTHLRNRRINVVQDSVPDVPMIQADRQQLRQLFLNLFTNGADAMPQGGTLTIRVRPTEPVPAGVLIEVVDTGVGIAPTDLVKVMEPFFTTKPEGKGTGLGLAICRRIVQEHGGTIELASTVAQGTTVRMQLPVRNGTNGTFLKTDP